MVQLCITISVLIVCVGAHVYSNTMRTMVVEQGDHSKCRIYTHKNDVLAFSKMCCILTLSEEEFAAKIRECHKIMHKKNRATFSFIYPGTKWCGPGNVADHVDDFGSQVEVDKCCKQHDFCPKYIKPGTCKFNICNNGSFLYSHCECDRAFQQCLHQVKSSTARALKSMYFDIIGMRCINEAPDSPTCIMSDVVTKPPSCELHLHVVT